MKYFNTLLFVICSLFFVPVKGQVTIIVDSIPEYTPAGDQIFLAGDINGWNPGDTAYILKKNINNLPEITLEEKPEGTQILFKFTRGSWDVVEKGPNGEEIANRQFTYGNGDTLHVIIYNWADGGGGNSTAAENVSIIDEDFYMPQLDRTRRIWLYLPPDYDVSDDLYPVIYMHDGQNIFDEATSYLGIEWKVDETLNDLAERGFKVPVVVAVDNGGNFRLDEYSPWYNTQYQSGGEGEAYIDFLTETLKPYIDQNYRTLTDRKNTGIMGSSMGGFISHYGLLKYQEVFSKSGNFSPAYFFSDTVWMFTGEADKQFPLKIYQVAGDQEGWTMVPDMLAMHDTLINLGFDETEVFTKVVEGGEHNELLWQQQFEQAYLWLFASFANDINEQPKAIPIKVYPNPVISELSLPDLDIESIDSIHVISLTGQIVIQYTTPDSDILNLVNLKPGTYLIKVYADDLIYLGKFIKRNP